MFILSYLIYPLWKLNVYHKPFGISTEHGLGTTATFVGMISYNHHSHSMGRAYNYVLPIPDGDREAQRG